MDSQTLKKGHTQVGLGDIHLQVFGERGGDPDGPLYEMTYTRSPSLRPQDPFFSV